MPEALKLIVTVSVKSLAAVLTACSADDPSADSGGPAASRVGDDFDRQDMVVTAVCQPSELGGADIEVDGWDTQSWQHVASTFFRLPKTVQATDAFGMRRNPLTALCEHDFPPPDASDA